MTGSSDDRKRRGHHIEAQVADALATQGLRVLERNFAAKGGEIDILGMDGDTLVVIEVRSRRPGGVLPRETVNRHKRRRIVHAARSYLLQEGFEDAPVRFDVVEVIFEPDQRTGRVTWIRDAFDLDDT